MLAGAVRTIRPLINDTHRHAPRTLHIRAELKPRPAVARRPTGDIRPRPLRPRRKMHRAIRTRGRGGVVPERLVQVDDDDDERGVHPRDLVAHAGEELIDVDDGLFPVDVEEEDELRKLIFAQANSLADGK